MNKKAFTLIELLVVVLIIGILTAVALPQYQTAVWKARFATMKPIVKSIAAAEEAYYLANNTYTPDAANLDVDFPAVTNSSVGDVSSQYYFSWGYCNLYHSPTVTSFVECFLVNGDSRFLSYAIYFNHSASDSRGMQYCGSFGGSVSYKVCKTESGLASPTTSDVEGGYSGWEY